MAPHDLPPALLSELEQVCVLLAATAAAFARDERPTGELGVHTKSSQTDVVTVMDEATEALLRGRLAQLRPADAILGEEGEDTAGSSGLTWVIDPIDGTVNYLYGIPAWAVSVAVVLGDPHCEGGWTPVAGAVADPSRRLVHHARAGAGAWTCSEREALDGARGVGGIELHVSRETALSQALLATGFSYSEQVRADQARTLMQVLPQVRDIRRIGSAALDLCRVAEGSVDAYAEAMLNPWDIAAGWLIVTEAGGRVGGLTERGEDRPGQALTVAAPQALYEPVRALFAGA